MDPFSDKPPATALSIGEFLQQSKKKAVFDVRTPAEFAQGHLPGAINLPLFTDEERVEIGTLYKHNGKEASVRRGLDFVGPKMAQFVDSVRSHAGNGPVLVHCWRGGMRSGSMAWLLNTAGIPAQTLSGGYKSFRHWVLGVFDRPYDLRVVSGFTGSGKTEILWSLIEKKQQVLDWEALANHRGSAFGGIGQPPQPTTEQFENNMATILDAFDISKPVWVEDESRLIGRNQIPKSLFENKAESPVYLVNRSFEGRVARLVADYGGFPPNELAAKIEKIRDHLGGERTTMALEALESGDLAYVGTLTLAHYDRVYGASLKKKEDLIEISIEADGLDSFEIADVLIKKASEI